MLRQKFIAILIIINFSFLIINYTKAQDSSHLRISLLTCTPGEELYSTFGHSALRIIDSSLSFNDDSRDVVFNYGTFNFDDEQFYIKFIRGKLLYYLNPEPFSAFAYEYQVTGRGITEQVLYLTAEEKIKIQQALIENLKEENKYYKYDFFLDNCTTRLRDLIVKYKHPAPVFKPIMPEGTRFRQAIHQYLDRNHKYWSKLGIDILLGHPTDAVMTTAQSQFLPDNLMKSLDSANTNQQLVSSEKPLYFWKDTNVSSSLFTPGVIFSILLVLILLLSFSSNKFSQSFLNGFDGLFFFITGVAGVLLVLMWTATDHSMCKDNFNLLWAWPTHIIMAFCINSTKGWVKKYFGFTAIALSVLLLAWAFLPQQMNNALIPLVLLLIYRSAVRSF